MLIDYDYCTGCRTCEIACKQEYKHPAGKTGGVQVQEMIHTLASGKLYITYMPFFTKTCVFCMGRVKQNLQPACVKHCMARVLTFGDIEDLKRQIPEKRKAILWTS